MTSTVADHYANHLAAIYSWMVGDFDAACSHADKFYADIGLPAGNQRLAVDLGCGHGVHSIPLARRGYRVLSIDTSQQLLKELDSAVGDLLIHTVADDLTGFNVHLGSEPASLIACMGDTLTHLPSIDIVNTLIRDSACALTPDGWLTLSFRDYASHELTGPERFIPVRSDEHRIHICFLDFRPKIVLVHDILHAFVDASWRTTISAYPKLRLVPNNVVATAESNGLSLVHQAVDRGMLYLAFNRSQSQR